MQTTFDFQPVATAPAPGAITNRTDEFFPNCNTPLYRSFELTTNENGRSGYLWFFVCGSDECDYKKVDAR